MSQSRILALLQEMRRHLMDARQSHELILPDIPQGISVRVLTPASTQQTHDSPGREFFMGKVEELLSLSPASPGFINDLTTIVGGMYDESVQTEKILSIFGNVEQGEWDLFDPEKVQASETGALHYAAWWWLLEIAGSYIGPMRPEEEREITAQQAALALEYLFGGPDNWIATEQIEKSYRWDTHINHMDRLVQWGKIFQEHYNVTDPFEGFGDVLRVAEKLLEYKEESGGDH